MRSRSPSDQPTISVVIPHFDDLERLDLCLSALERQTCPRGAFEIIVADNASPQGPEAVRQVIRGRARLIIVAEKGAGPARNGGVAIARGETLAFTDADCVPESDWLEQGLAALASCDFAGGAMRVLVEDESHMTPEEAFERVFAFDNRTYVMRKGFTVTANLFCPRPVFEVVGGFRVGVSEDLDWSRRAIREGFRIGYADGAVVGHPARRTWAELVGKWRRLAAESHALTAATATGRFRWMLRTLSLPISAVAHTPAVMTSARISGASQRWAALVTLYRLRFWRCMEGLKLLGRPAA